MFSSVWNSSIFNRIYQPSEICCELRKVQSFRSMIKIISAGVITCKKFGLVEEVRCGESEAFTTVALIINYR